MSESGQTIYAHDLKVMVETMTHIARLLRTQAVKDVLRGMEIFVADIHFDGDNAKLCPTCLDNGEEVAMYGQLPITCRYCETVIED
jgi:hypothetical protein